MKISGNFRWSLLALMVLPGLGWLSLASTMVSGTFPVDPDTDYLLDQAFSPLTWQPRLETWATTPHPAGVLLQMAYLQLGDVIGLPAARSWVLLLLLSLIALFAIVLYKALFDFQTYIITGQNLLASSAALIAICLMPFAPSVYYVFASREEDAIGIVLFALAIFVMYRSPQLPSSKVAVLAWASSITLLWAWHLQYGAILALAALGAASLLVVRHLRRKGLDSKIPQAAVGLLIVGLTPILIHFASHLLGVVQYLPYQNTFTSLMSVIKQEVDPLQYLVVLGEGAAAAIGFNGAAPAVGWIALASVFIAVVLCALAIGRAGAGNQWTLWTLLVSLSWPVLYEPNSLERWTAATLTVLLTLPRSVALIQSKANRGKSTPNYAY